MRKNLFQSILGLTIILAIISCGQASENYAVTTDSTSGPGIAYNLIESKQDAYKSESKTDKNSKGYAIPVSNRKLIRNGNIKFETTDILKAESHIKNFTHQFGGFVSFEQQTRSDWMIRNDLEIRIPSHLFQPFIDSILNSNFLIDEKNIKVVDVTNHYIDTESRLETKKIVLSKYVAHLQKAQKIEDILEVERQIGYIREEIESAEKQMRSMNDQISFSTLKIEFYQTVTQPERESENSYFKGLKNGWKGVEYFVLFLTNIWPILVLVFGVIVFWRIRKK